MKKQYGQVLLYLKKNEWYRSVKGWSFPYSETVMRLSWKGFLLVFFIFLIHLLINIEMMVSFIILSSYYLKTPDIQTTFQIESFSIWSAKVFVKLS